jgi:hypothetical protein
MAEGASPRSRATEDQVTLIGNEVRAEHWSCATFPYVLFKAAPSFVFFWPQSLTTFTALSIIDVWLCISTFGDLLVGLSWSFDRPSWAGIVSYRVEPPPFVPTPFDAVVFWGALVASIGFTTCVTLFNIAKRRVAPAIVLTVLAALQAANIRCYWICLGIARDVRRSAARAPDEEPQGGEESRERCISE